MSATNYNSITRPIRYIKSPNRNIDAWYGPYDTLEDAVGKTKQQMLDDETIDIRYLGMTVGVYTHDEAGAITGIVEYWFKNGVEDENLVEKVSTSGLLPGNFKIAAFDSNSGQGVMNSIISDSNGKVRMPECTFTAPNDKQFRKWSTDRTGTEDGELNPGDDVAISEQYQIFFAIWENSENTPCHVTLTVEGEGNVTIEHHVQEDDFEVSKGTLLNMTCEPYSGHQVNSVTVNNDLIDTPVEGKYDILVNNDIEIKVVFGEVPPVANDYAVTLQIIGEGGYVEVDGAQYSTSQFPHNFNRNNNSQFKFTCVPDDGYVADEVKINGIELYPIGPRTDTYEFTVTEDTNIEVSFKSNAEEPAGDEILVYKWGERNDDGDELGITDLESYTPLHLTDRCEVIPDLIDSISVSKNLYVFTKNQMNIKLVCITNSVTVAKPFEEKQITSGINMDDFLTEGYSWLYRTTFVDESNISVEKATIIKS